MAKIANVFGNLFGGHRKEHAVPDAILHARVELASPESETDFKFLTENIADVLCRLGPDMTIRYISPSSSVLFGFAPEEVVGNTPDAFVLAADLPLLVTTFRRLFAGETLQVPATFRVLRKDGEMIWIESNSQVVTDPVTGRPSGMILVMRDITDRKILQEKLSTLALTDSLTGLANRRAFDTALQREWLRTLRDGNEMSLLLLDLDRFKEFNDRYGHQVGDDCLKAVATAVEEMLRRPGDMAARYGGEEIAVVLPNTSAAGALKVAEQLRTTIELLRIPHLGNPDGNNAVTVSIGAATALAGSDGTNRMPDALLTAADQALYQAKHNGRNCVAASQLLPPGITPPNS